MSRYIRFISALALIPMVIRIGFPSRAVSVSMRGSYGNVCVTSIALAVGIAINVSRLVKLLTFASRTLVPMVIRIRLPFSLGSVSGVSESRGDYVSANCTGFGSCFCSRARRGVSYNGILCSASTSICVSVSFLIVAAAIVAISASTPRIRASVSAIF